MINEKLQAHNLSYPLCIVQTPPPTTTTTGNASCKGHLRRPRLGLQALTLGEHRHLELHMEHPSGIARIALAEAIRDNALICLQRRLMTRPMGF
jgi:hypothetical protein